MEAPNNKGRSPKTNTDDKGTAVSLCTESEQNLRTAGSKVLMKYDKLLEMGNY